MAVAEENVWMYAMHGQMTNRTCVPCVMRDLLVVCACQIDWTGVDRAGKCAFPCWILVGAFKSHTVIAKYLARVQYGVLVEFVWSDGGPGMFLIFEMIFPLRS